MLNKQETQNTAGNQLQSLRRNASSDLWKRELYKASELFYTCSVQANVHYNAL